MSSASSQSFANCVAFVALGLGAVSTSPAFAQTSAPDVATVGAEALMQENWRETIARTSVPHEGCFEAEYPNAVWVEAACTVAPDKVYVPRGHGGLQTVGNGADYAASVTNLMSAAMGTFPAVSGVTSEKDGSSNVYSKLTVKVAVTHGSTAAPGCASNAGTTGETNNLTPGSCSGASGATPYIQFTESD
jgi:hypothetical protein